MTLVILKMNIDVSIVFEWLSKVHVILLVGAIVELSSVSVGNVNDSL